MKFFDGRSLRNLVGVLPVVVPFAKAADDHAVVGDTSAGVARDIGVYPSTARGSSVTTSHDPLGGWRSCRPPRTRPRACARSNHAFARSGD